MHLWKFLQGGVGLADGDDDDDKLKVLWAGVGHGSSTTMGPCRNHMVAGCPPYTAHNPAPPISSHEEGSAGRLTVPLAGGELS